MYDLALEDCRLASKRKVMPKNSRVPVRSNANLFGLGLIAVAIASVVIVAIFFWPGGFKVVAEGQGAKVELTFTESRVDLSELLDKLLKQTENDDSKRRLALSILQAHGLYRVPSAEAAVALRGIEETDATRDFVRAVRATLYDLAGPFSRPATFLEARDDRVLLALDDLLQSNPSSPLVAKLWEMSLDWKGIFFPRSISVSIHADSSLKKGIAATCAGSVLLGKAAQVSAKNGFIDIQLDDAKSCEPTSAENLLAGKVAAIWVSLADMNDLVGEGIYQKDRRLEGILSPLPKHLSSERSSEHLKQQTMLRSPL
jgi:hypothetical protein